jgi:hypothetical protein
LSNDVLRITAPGRESSTVAEAFPPDRLSVAPTTTPGGSVARESGRNVAWGAATLAKAIAG